MKKKTHVILGAIVIAVILGAVLFFVLQGEGNESTEEVSLKGTWLVFQHAGETPRDEFMVFDDTDVSYYQKGDSKPVATSEYSIKNGKLEAPDIEKSFTIRIISDNNVELIEPSTIVWRLLLVGGSDVDITEIVPQNIEGVYDVKVVGEESRQEETMTFTESHLSFVQGGSETISSDYYISEDGILHLMTPDREYYVYVNGNNLLFIGVADNGVWELHKTE
ncbi:MAG: hypothetical protein K5644_02670 [Lachnospiraceae bacterium]|nr:hypothetical protein [Lachnospiraceae bacterium]